MSIKITIVMAIYNPNIEFLEQQIKSIINQTKKPDQIIFIDDCSENYSKVFKTIKKYLSKTRVRYKIYRNEINKGVNYTFARSYELLNRGIFFFSDQDDIWYENKIEIIIKKYYELSCPFLIINDCLFYKNGKIIHTTSKCKTIKNITGSNKNFVAGCCSAIDSRILKYVKSGVFKFLNYDDQLHAIADLLNSRFVYNEPLQLYRRHEKNVSQSIGNFPQEHVNYLRSTTNLIINNMKEFTFYNYVRMSNIDLASLLKSLNNEEIKYEDKITHFRKIITLIYSIKNNEGIYTIISNIFKISMLTAVPIMLGFFISLFTNLLLRSNKC